LRAPPTPRAEEDAEGVAFRLVSVAATGTPDGCAGRDWLVYHIAQGANVIMGYRRGTVKTVTAEVELIVSGLNERRVHGKARSGAHRGRPPAAAAAAKAEAPAEPADE
jgi:hypothetical protein